MPINYRRANEYLERLFKNRTGADLREQTGKKHHEQRSPITGGSSVHERALDKRWSTLNSEAWVRESLLDPLTNEQVEAYRTNIENLIGTVKLPVGVAGPLRVNGLFAQDDFFVPLATTEAALVASYNRGAQLITAAGGCTSTLLDEGVSRAPGFAFRTIQESGEFAIWVLSQVDTFREVAESTTSHGKLVDMQITLEGNHAYISFEFHTGDASGQNMVTIATEAICEYIIENTPIKPKYHFVEANLSGDKKASYQSYLLVRGKRVSAEVTIPEELIRKSLHTTPSRMLEYWTMSAVGGVLSGTVGIQGHYANGLAALYIACGQDPACVAESAVGVTRFELTEEGGLYASVTLPNIMVGTVGGGTGLPSQKACLEILGLRGSGNAKAFAEVTAGIILAGELSIIGALCSGDFSRAHKILARARKRSANKEQGARG